MKRFLFASIILGLTATSINAKVIRNYTSQSDDKLVFKVDSIDYRSDLTRVYGKLFGRPHTSNRIDGVTIMTTGTTSTSNDIDGVDFHRYFQWEEEGSIPVELDFPAMKDSQGIQLIFDTPLGHSHTHVKVQPTQRK